MMKTIELVGGPCCGEQVEVKITIAKYQKAIGRNEFHQWSVVNRLTSQGFEVFTYDGIVDSDGKRVE